MKKNLIKTYNFIVGYYNEHGYMPAIREICKGVNINSTATIHRHLLKLTELGYIQTEHPGSPRAFRLTGKGL